MRLWLFACLWLWSSVALAQSEPDLVTPEFRRSIDDSLQRAEMHRLDGRLDEAERFLQQGYTLDPEYAPVVKALARLMLQRKNFPESEVLFRQALALDADDVEATFGLIDSIAHQGASVAQNTLALTQARAMTKTGTAHRQAWRRIARILAYLGRDDEASEAWSQVKRMGSLDDAVKAELAAFYLKIGERDRAQKWYLECAQTSDNCKQSAQLLDSRQMHGQDARAEQARKRSALLRPVFTQIDAHLQRNQHQVAHTRLVSLRQSHPLAPGIHRRLGITARHLGDRELAERSLLQALALGARSSTDFLLLATLYEEEITDARPARAELAAHYFEQAHRAAPQNFSTQFRYARALAKLQRYDQAYGLTTHALSQNLDDSLRADVSTLHQKIKDRRSHVVAKPPILLQEETSYLDAKSLRNRGEPEAASALLRGIPMSDRTAPHWDLLGQISEDEGNPRDALGHYRRALTVDPTLVDTRYRMAKIYRRQGTPKSWLPHLKQAAQGGSRHAQIDVIEHSVRPREVVGRLADIFILNALRRASHQLVQLRGDHDFGEAEYQSRIQTIHRNIGSRLQTMYASAGAALTALIGLLVLAVRRRYGGISVAEFVIEKPSAGPEVQRVLSAIRHEVLKHNTTALTGLVDALDDDDDARERVQWCLESVLGTNETSDQAAILRLEDYLEQLRRIGRSHGVRLNLQTSDPTFSALISGFDALDEVLPRLASTAVGRPFSPAHIKALRAACEDINGTGYRGVVALLDMLKVTLVDADLLMDIFNGIRREPSSRGREILPLQLDVADGALPFQVAVTLHEFEDILRNPMRNAVQASSDDSIGETPVHVGLTVERQLEPITGLMSVVLKIKDRSPVALDPSILQSQDVERGLGLTFRLLIEHEGTISVAEELEPWCKSVVIQLPLVETEGDWTL